MPVLLTKRYIQMEKNTNTQKYREKMDKTKSPTFYQLQTCLLTVHDKLFGGKASKNR